MFDPSYTRYGVLQARALPDEAKRNDQLIGLMAAAMTEIRLGRACDGNVTRADLKHCGFTDDELTRLGDPALNIAAASWHGNRRQAA